MRWRYEEDYCNQRKPPFRLECGYPRPGGSGGASSEGAEVEIIDLYKLDNCTGCVSCFGCKTEGYLGKCVYKDGLADVLEKIRNADGLILGSPVYLGDISAGLRALYERLIFQYITYKTEPRSYSDRRIPVVFILTSNAPEGYYDDLLKKYNGSLEAFIGPNMTWSRHFPPLFPNLCAVSVNFCNSGTTTLVRAADIVANHIYHQVQVDEAFCSCAENLFVIRQP